MLSDQAIEQRGLADIRPSDDGDREAHAVKRWQKPVGSPAPDAISVSAADRAKPSRLMLAVRQAKLPREALPAAAAGRATGIVGQQGLAMSLAPALRPLSGSAAQPVWRRA